MGDEEYKEDFSIVQTVGAAVVCIASFLILTYIAAPVVEMVLNLIGKYLIPARFGGGEEVDNPGLLTLLGRSIVISALCAFGGLYAGFWLFYKAHPKVVAAVFALAVMVWGVWLLSLSMAIQGVAIASAIFCVSVGPPFLIAFFAWEGGFE